MTTTEAAKLLELPENATPEQVEARFQELRSKFEDRIAKAPTPGLKAKYRENLDEITQAFETLTLAADSSALPVLKRQSSGGPASPRADTAPLPPQASPLQPSAKRKTGGGREFLVVATVAVLVLAGGGWLILKIRADNAEKARIAAEQKAESEHQAALAQQSAEAKLLVEQQEKEMAAAAAKAEQARLDKLAAETRVKLAEIRVAWDAYDQKVKAEERKVSDLKSDERSLANQLKGASSPDLLKLRAELAAEQEFSAWLSDTLVRHPARVARVQAEELLNAKQIEDAATAATHAQEELAKLDAEIAATSRSMLNLAGQLMIELSPAEAAWQLTDAYGQKRSGTGPAALTDIPFGLVRVHFSLRGFAPKDAQATLRRKQPLTLKAEFVAPTVAIESNPAGAEVWVADELKGKTPASFALPGDGPIRAQLRLAGYTSKDVALDPTDPASLKQAVTLSPDSNADPQTLTDAQLRQRMHGVIAQYRLMPMVQASPAWLKSYDDMDATIDTSPRWLLLTTLSANEKNLATLRKLPGGRAPNESASTSTPSAAADDYSNLSDNELRRRLRDVIAQYRLQPAVQKNPAVWLKGMDDMEALIDTASRGSLLGWLSNTQQTLANFQDMAAAQSPGGIVTMTASADGNQIAIVTKSSANDAPTADYSNLSDNELRQRLHQVIAQIRLLPNVRDNPEALEVWSKNESRLDSVPRQMLESMLGAFEKYHAASSKVIPDSETTNQATRGSR